MILVDGFKEYVLYVLGFGVAFFIAGWMTPISKTIAFKVGALDHPKERGIHTKTMPLAGGLAIYIGFTFTMLLVLPFYPSARSLQIVGLLLGGTIITVVGFLDDIYDLSPRLRIVFQVLAALIAILTGTLIETITVPFASGMQIEFGFFSELITLLWIVGVTNAVNLIDGLDGLATGVASIASLALLIIALIFGDPAVAGVAIMLTSVLAGSCLGFLPHNFNPAKIFMGDTGSTFLGYALAVISIQTMLKTYTALTLIVAALVLGLPLVDTFFAIIRRIASGKSIAEGDRGHLHHRLVDGGLSHRKAVLMLYGVSGGFGIAGILVALDDVTLAIVVVSFILLFWLTDIFKRRFANRR